MKFHLWKIVLLTSLAFLFAWICACNSPSQQKKDELTFILKNLNQEDIKSEPDSLKNREENVVSFIHSIELFLQENPTDPDAHKWSFEIAQLYLSELSDPLKACEWLKHTYSIYPTSISAPEALFLSANIYHQDLNDITQARKLYQKFIQKYPDHPLTKQAFIELNNLPIPLPSQIK